MTESRDDDGFVTRSPQDWHFEACQRGADFDAMQLAVLKWRTDFCGHDAVSVIAEFPLLLQGVVVAFADVARIIPDSNSRRFYQLYEVVPRIYSAGAVVRQCRALRTAAEHCLRDRVDVAQSISVFAVVPANDPKLDTLRAMYDETLVLAWDMAEGRPAEWHRS